MFKLKVGVYLITIPFSNTSRVQLNRRKESIVDRMKASRNPAKVNAVTAAKSETPADLTNFMDVRFVFLLTVFQNHYHL